MRTWMTGGSAQARTPRMGPALAIASLLTLCIPLFGAPALAASPKSTTKQTVAKKPDTAKRATAHVTPVTARMSSSKTSALKSSKAVYAGRSAYAGRGYGGISCVPYARSVTGIDVKGNAGSWWANAAGLYERGSAPEAGSVMNFRATGRMRLGHVAVVARVVDSRTVEIDHANWAGPGATKGGVSRGIPVIDVSENNDWSAVRVGLGHSGDYGSVYPTYGFIYGRPDRGQMMANSSAAPRAEEVAEAPARFRDVDVINRAIR